MFVELHIDLLTSNIMYGLMILDGSCNFIVSLTWYTTYYSLEWGYLDKYVGKRLMRTTKTNYIYYGIGINILTYN